MSKTFDEIKELEKEQHFEEDSLEEVEILDENKGNNSKTMFKAVLLVILLFFSIGLGYYLAGLYMREGFFKKQVLHNVSNETIKENQTMSNKDEIKPTFFSGNRIILQKTLEELLRKENKDLLTLNNIAILLCEMGRYNEALDYAETLIIKEPSNAYYWNTFGIVLTYLNLYDDAEKCFKKAISLKNDEGVFYYNLGNLYERIGNLTLSKENYLNYLAKGDKYNTNNINFVKQKIRREF
jgi:tetratricopeptide (TPR) repeat protein